MNLYLTFFAKRNGGRCLNVANVEEFTDEYSITHCFTREHFVANVPENSDAFHCNQEIALILQNSGIPLRGAEFVSLKRRF